jgi:transcriptional regulator with XRE-family HTH domain
MNRNALSLKAIGARLRYARVERGFSLEKLADYLAKSAGSRPSIAKLSRIETGLQPVPIDILPGLAALTGIPKSDLRPDLIALMREAAE